MWIKKISILKLKVRGTKEIGKVCHRWGRDREEQLPAPKNS
jgi:hypothetical protein